MVLSPSFRRVTTAVVLAALLACADAIQAVVIPPAWDRRKAAPEPLDEGLQGEQGGADNAERGDGPADLFTRKPQPVPKVPSAYVPQAKPQPKPRPGAKATPPPGAPAPTPPITRPT
jgi:hypothetical protein